MINTTPYATRIRWDILESLVAYAETGRPTGGFLEAVLANDLMDAAGRADARSRLELCDICAFVYMELPAPCHGSRERVRAWIRRGGLRGFTAEPATVSEAP